MVLKMRRGLFYIVIGIISVGIILLNTSNTLKYLTCEDPNNYIYDNLVVEDKTMTITFDVTTSSESFSEYEYHIKDNTLYIGVKYKMIVLGEISSRETVTLDVNQTIEKVVLKGANTERIIYPES